MANPRIHECDFHSDASFNQLVDALVLASRRASRDEFRSLQQAFGLNFEPEGLPDDVALRAAFAGPVSGSLWDWMHILASGGVATWESGALHSSLDVPEHFLQSVGCVRWFTHVAEEAWQTSSLFLSAAGVFWVGRVVSGLCY